MHSYIKTCPSNVQLPNIKDPIPTLALQQGYTKADSSCSPDLASINISKHWNPQTCDIPAQGAPQLATSAEVVHSPGIGKLLFTASCSMLVTWPVGEKPQSMELWSGWRSLHQNTLLITAISCWDQLMQERLHCRVHSISMEPWKYHQKPTGSKHKSESSRLCFYPKGPVAPLGLNASQHCATQTPSTAKYSVGRLQSLMLKFNLPKTSKTMKGEFSGSDIKQLFESL